MRIWPTCNGHPIRTAPLNVSPRLLRPRAHPMSLWRAGAFSAVRSNLLEEPCLGQCPVRLVAVLLKCLQTASSSSDPAPLHLQRAAAANRAAAPPLLVTPGPAAVPSERALPVPGSAFLQRFRQALAGLVRPCLRLRTCPLVRSSSSCPTCSPSPRSPGPVCGQPCDNPQCTDVCPRVDDPARRSGHRHHACDACHKRGW